MREISTPPDDDGVSKAGHNPSESGKHRYVSDGSDGPDILALRS